jgi:hypothetical protein
MGEGDPAYFVRTLRNVVRERYRQPCTARKHRLLLDAI